jgi:malonyl-CoA/methylmalonyl-CoA synthetase
MTEASVSTSNPYHGERRAGSVGPALTGISIRVTDLRTGTELPLGLVGSIEVKGPNVFRGYLNDKQKTRDAFRSDGYFVTGDIGRMHLDGYLEFLARTEDLVLCGHERIDPRAIELAIDQLPGVLESAVVGIPRPGAGDLLGAVAARRQGAAISEANVMQALAQRLSRDMLPAQVRFVEVASVAWSLATVAAKRTQRLYGVWD